MPRLRSTLPDLLHVERCPRLPALRGRMLLLLLEDLRKGRGGSAETWSCDEVAEEAKPSNKSVSSAAGQLPRRLSRRAATTSASTADHRLNASSSLEHCRSKEFDRCRRGWRGTGGLWKSSSIGPCPSKDCCRRGRRGTAGLAAVEAALEVGRGGLELPGPATTLALLCTTFCPPVVLATSGWERPEVPTVTEALPPTSAPR